MTREEIEAMPADELTRLLAEKVIGADIRSGVFDRHHGQWNPTVDRNDLQELLKDVPMFRWVEIESYIDFAMLESADGDEYAVRFYMTCDPLLICRAVAVAVCGGDV